MPYQGHRANTRFNPTESQLRKEAARKEAGLPPLSRSGEKRSTFRAGRNKVTFDWRGKELIENMRAAARVAVNETVDAARDEAKATHDPMWVNRPTRWSKLGGQLEEEIGSEHADPASQKVHGPNPVGRFGFARKRGFYGLFHEVGTVHEYEKPVIRPVADKVFPTLIDRIRRRRRIR